MAAVAERRWEAELWAPGNGPLHACARQNGFEAHALPMGRYTNARKSARDIVCYGLHAVLSRHCFTKAICERPVDLVYINGPRVLPCAAGLREPVIFHSHSVIDKPYSRWIAQRSLHATRGTIVASSEYLASRLRSPFDRQRVCVIYNGVPDCGFRFSPNDGRPIRIGIVGRIAPEKGQLEFLDAVRLLVDRKAMQFTVVGEGMFSTSGYEERIRQTGASLGVTIAGWRNPAELYRDLDILIVPSAAHDANPRVLMEAMSAGVCTIAYRSGGIPEIATDGYDGMITDRNPGALANAIGQVVGDPAFRRRFVYKCEEDL